jgi:alcohol dehydrogenase (cytochrome c)
VRNRAEVSRLKRPSRILVAIIGIILACAGVAAILVFRSLPAGWTWRTVSWRGKLFREKAEGHVPGLSWRELWFMTHVQGGFGLEGFAVDGFSLEGSIINPFTTEADRQYGRQFFDSHCEVCHGKGGSGAYGPPLNRSGLAHGDSDLALYKVVRDGIPGTGMAGFVMPPLERWRVIGYLRSLQTVNSGQSAEDLPPIAIHVSSEQIRDAGTKTDEWLTYSGSLSGQRYTSLNEITPKNVARLQLRWIHQFETSESDRSESTPIVSGGVIFATEPPATVVALDASSGAVRWRYNRNLPDKLPVCCARSNRGLAILGNVVYFGSLDCYLNALDAATGNVIWQSQVCRPADGFTMTGAPLVANQSVVVGVAGGEYGVRGFLAAYDAKTGRQQWKFDTIPGPGEFGHETWKNDAWKTGGGPTWITGSYDPSLDLIYWGVGNPAPGFNGDVRPGDNLFTDSVIALHGSSGKLAWYFQFTPHDEHDWDAAQTPVLANIPIKGVTRPVLCVANRNGFYYVLDRTNGQFILGVPFVTQNWANGLDASGRPIPTASAEVSQSGRLTRPSVAGGINWQNTAFDHKSGMIFIPATEGASVFTKSEDPERGDNGFYTGSAGGAQAQPDPVIRALDAATGARKWELPLPRWKGSFAYGYSGLLATGGGLVFGSSGGYLFAIDSATGRELWRVFLGGDTYAAPISFTVDGHQVVLVSAGRTQFMFGL